MNDVIELDDALTSDSDKNDDDLLSIQLRSQFELLRAIHESFDNDKIGKSPIEEMSVSSYYESSYEENMSLKTSQDLHQLKLGLALSTALGVEREIASLTEGILDLETIVFQEDQQHLRQDRIEDKGGDNMKDDNATNDSMEESK